MIPHPRPKTVRLTALFACLTSFFCFTASVAEANTPNVIFMLTDDLGYSDIGCYGAKKIKTPHIDKLADDGFMCTNFHTAASMCSPSRAAFLTGGYPQRAGLYMGINPKREAHWFLGLSPDEITIAEQFKKQGYKTYIVGKWHLGTEPEFHPKKQGFDHYYGMPCNYSHSTAFYDEEKLVYAETPLDKLTQLYTTRVTEIIKKQAREEKPFFLYYSHNYPHTPYKASKRFAGSSKDGVRGDMMQELDWGVGEMMKALKESGIAENTIVIFTSDNGPVSNEYAKPYRGRKLVSFEGGHRVPFIMNWPARMKKKINSSVDLHAMDLFPTLSQIIGAPLPKGRVYDGESLLPLLEGKSLKRKTTFPFYYYNCENLQAVRSGHWKLHLTRDSKQIPWWDKNKDFTKLKKPVLYNLEIDPGETKDVASGNPEKVKELQKLAETIRTELGEFMQRGKGQRPTGSISLEAPVISNPRDWETVSARIRKALNDERRKRSSKKK